MRFQTVYLEAEDRTQELLNVKWALRSAGYSVSSVWHDGDAHALSSSARQWGEKELERVQRSQTLVVLASQTQPPTTRMATMLGFALAHRIQICWIGLAVEAIRNLRSVQTFNNVDEFRQHLLGAAPEGAD